MLIECRGRTQSSTAPFVPEMQTLAVLCPDIHEPPAEQHASKTATARLAGGMSVCQAEHSNVAKAAEQLCRARGVQFTWESRMSSHSPSSRQSSGARRGVAARPAHSTDHVSPITAHRLTESGEFILKVAASTLDHLMTRSIPTSIDVVYCRM